MLVFASLSPGRESPLKVCTMTTIKQRILLREHSTSRVLDSKTARSYRIGCLLYIVSCWFVVGLIAAIIYRLLA